MLFVQIFTILLLLLFGLVLFFSFQAEDLSDIAGHPSAPAESQEELGLTRVEGPGEISEMLQLQPEVRLTEEAINEYLQRTLAAKQLGSFEGFAEYVNTWVRLVDGQFEVIIERKLFERSVTVSLHFEVMRQGDLFLCQAKRGRFGNLRVFGGFLAALQPAVRELHDLYQEEIAALTETGRVVIEQDRVILERGY